jgi:hypothetical protein
VHFFNYWLWVLYISIKLAKCSLIRHVKSVSALGVGAAPHSEMGQDKFLELLNAQYRWNRFPDKINGGEKAATSRLHISIGSLMTVAL